MNYDKLSRSLRYYYEKGIMQKVKDVTELMHYEKIYYVLCNMYYLFFKNLLEKLVNYVHVHVQAAL